MFFNNHFFELVLALYLISLDTKFYFMCMKYYAPAYALREAINVYFWVLNRSKLLVKFFLWVFLNFNMEHIRVVFIALC